MMDINFAITQVPFKFFAHRIPDGTEVAECSMSESGKIEQIRFVNDDFDILFKLKTVGEQDIKVRTKVKYFGKFGKLMEMADEFGLFVYFSHLNPLGKESCRQYEFSAYCESINGDVFDAF